MQTILSLLGLVAVVGIFVRGVSPVADAAPDDEEQNEDERWAELVSADVCDSYWDPPDDDI